MQLFSLGRFKVEVRRRPYQRSLNLRVPAPGLLRVSCPERVSLKAIFSFIEEKMDFIESREKEWLRALDQASVKNFMVGEECPFLGTPRKLEIIQRIGRDQAVLEGDVIKVFVSEDEAASVQNALIRFYKKAGRNYLSHLVKVQSEKMNLYPRDLSFRSQRTRWGSCSSQGKISLNWRLVVAPSEVAEYVVIHELAHLKHQDHSSRFWGLVESHCPKFREHKKWLREHQIQFEFLDERYLMHSAPKL